MRRLKHLKKVIKETIETLKEQETSKDIMSKIDKSK